MTDRVEYTLKKVATLLKHLRPTTGTFEQSWIDELLPNIEMSIQVNKNRRRENLEQFHKLNPERMGR